MGREGVGERPRPCPLPVLGVWGVTPMGTGPTRGDLEVGALLLTWRHLEAQQRSRGRLLRPQALSSPVSPQGPAAMPPSPVPEPQPHLALLAGPQWGSAGLGCAGLSSACE